LRKKAEYAGHCRTCSGILAIPDEEHPPRRV
jgi:hypothetical protein